MSMSPNSGKYAYFAGGYADDHSGPALGVADSLKPETRNLKPPVRKAFRTGSIYKGTYYYVVPDPLPARWYDLSAEEWILFGVKGAGHTGIDVVPYVPGGNVRGDDSKSPE